MKVCQAKDSHDVPFDAVADKLRDLNPNSPEEQNFVEHCFNTAHFEMYRQRDGFADERERVIKQTGDSVPSAEQYGLDSKAPPEDLDADILQLHQRIRDIKRKIDQGWAFDGLTQVLKNADPELTAVAGDAEGELGKA